MADIQIIGVGSPHGGDRVGWELASQLAERLSWDSSIAVRRVSAPVDLLDDLPPASGTLLICDGSRGAGPLGTISRFDWPWDEEQAASAIDPSSHAFGLAPTLRLGDALQCLPGRVVIWTIEVEPGPPQSEFAPAVQQALSLACDRILQELQHA